MNSQTIKENLSQATQEQDESNSEYLRGVLIGLNVGIAQIIDETQNETAIKLYALIKNILKED